MKEEDLHFFDDFVTEDSIYFIDSENVRNENQTLLDSRITFEKVKKPVEPKNIEGNNNKECRKDSWIKTAVEESYNENEATDIDDEDSSTSENKEKNKKKPKTKVNNHKVRRSSRSTIKIVPVVDDSSDEERDFSADEDSSYTPEDEEVKGDKYKRRIKSGSVKNVGKNLSPIIIYEDKMRNNYSDEESDNSDPEEESEKTSYNMKKEIRDSDFSEEDYTNSSHTEDEAMEILKGRCPREFKRTGHLKRQRKKYNCPLCDETFSTRISRGAHMKKKHDIIQRKKYKCSNCDKIFPRQYHLNQHFQTKHNDFKYTCPHCPKEHKHEYLLKKHVESKHLHSLCAKYSCPHCPQAFTRSDNLKKHVQNQHGKPGKKYKCPHCPNRFKRSDNLKRHIKNLHGDPLQRKNHECPLCDKIVLNKHNLNKHIKSKHKST
ncbi:unnamed protein product [Brassicogethes aeneus]|uniref:C2H2-type domain-containing protein n=1 Tax=Brassicogethes aeneus TaxID=1431903 RepID=A0A9P0BJV5_BRAAE|nr:unnamed protein product [Brassicogethes aeneus]